MKYLKLGFIEVDTSLASKAEAEAVARLINAEVQEEPSAGVYSLKLNFEGFKDLADKSSALGLLGWGEEDQLIKFIE